MKTIPPTGLNVRQTIIRFFCLNVVALALAGCASSLVQVDLSVADTPPAGKAAIFVIRPAYLSYAARKLTVKVDNAKIADLINLSYTSFLVKPGEVRLSGEGSFFSWPRKEITLQAAEGQTYYLVWSGKETASFALMMYLFPSMDMDALHWESVSEDKAQLLLDSTHYVRAEMPEISK